MKNINLQVDDETLAKAEQFAMKLNTSVTGLLSDYLHQLPPQAASKEDARRRLVELSRSAQGEVGARNWTRDNLYDR